MLKEGGKKDCKKKEKGIKKKRNLLKGVKGRF